MSFYITFPKLLAFSSIFNKFLCKLSGSVIKFLFRYSIQRLKRPCEYVMKHKIRLTTEAENEQWLTMFAWIIFLLKLKFLPSFTPPKNYTPVPLIPSPNKPLLCKTSRLDGYIIKLKFSLSFSFAAQQVMPPAICGWWLSTYHSAPYYRKLCKNTQRPLAGNEIT